MDRSAVCQLLESQPGAWHSYPFGEAWRVYKVKDKLFAVVFERKGRLSLNLKCEPEQALMLRDLFAEVEAAYHMNKRHWNTVYLDGDLPSGEIIRLVEHSWLLVVQGLKKADRDAVLLLKAQQQDSAAPSC